MASPKFLPIKLFQSAPGFLAGRYISDVAGGHAVDLVSIRSRLFSREILGDALMLLSYGLFQSAPGFLAGRYNTTAAGTPRR